VVFALSPTSTTVRNATVRVHPDRGPRRRRGTARRTTDVDERASHEAPHRRSDLYRGKLRASEHHNRKGNQNRRTGRRQCRGGENSPPTQPARQQTRRG
jgi:hypothetical protein